MAGLNVHAFASLVDDDSDTDDLPLTHPVHKEQTEFYVARYEHELKAEHRHAAWTSAYLVPASNVPGTRLGGTPPPVAALRPAQPCPGSLVAPARAPLRLHPPARPSWTAHHLGRPKSHSRKQVF